VKKMIIGLCILLFFCITPVWSQFYEDLTLQERKELAEAYYLVGKQYQQVGKKEKGDDFIRMAFRIYPMLSPETIRYQPRSVQTALALAGAWMPKIAVIPAEVAARNAVKFQFSRFLRAFMTQDIEVLGDVLASTVYLPGIDRGISLKEAETVISRYLEENNISEIPPSRLFVLDSISVSPVSQDIWEASIRLADRPALRIDHYINPGENKQRFYFRLIENNWLLFAAGKIPERFEAYITPEESIKSSLTQMIDAFKNKDAQKTSSFFTDPFQNIPLGTYISRSELKETFVGYFQENELDISAFDKIKTEIVYADTSLKRGRIYKAYIDFGSNPGAKLPFWRSFTGYYFSFDENTNSWKIFAIF